MGDQPATCTIAVVDHGTGNLTSIIRALELSGARAVRVTTPEPIGDADGVVLPGVGAFPKAMESLGRLGLDSPLVEFAGSGRPMLGVCLGMQMLFDSSDELGGADGLGLLGGRVTQLSAHGLRLPHIGWSELNWVAENPLRGGLSETSPMYHVHSFVARPEVQSDVLATATHGEEFVAAVARDNVIGVQFHPEKSAAEGLLMLANFVSLCQSGLIAR